MAKGKKNKRTKMFDNAINRKQICCIPICINDNNTNILINVNRLISKSYSTERNNALYVPGKG